MARKKDLSLVLLRALDIAVLHRVGPRKYEFFGHIPKFYCELFPSGKNGEPSAEPWTDSPMLEFFLEDAERFFEERREGNISSGMWQEDGKMKGETALLATAVSFEGVQAIMVRMLFDDYAERTRMLRKAREQLLENRGIALNLEIYRTKSRVDALTKVYNRAAFDEFLSSEIRRSQALNYALSVLFLDIDDFKRVNDSLGHLVGDAVLGNLARLLVKTLRRGDIIARYGGEEFIVLLHEPPERAYMIGEKVRARIAAMAQQEIPSITVSMGCTTYIPPESPESFLQRADLALYDAKRNGKNIVRVR